MYALAGRLAALRVGRRRDQVFDFLDQDLVFMAVLVHVAHRVGGEGALRDVALDADIGGSRHWLLP